jgi:DNA-binding PadR family transcriptional regulator
MDRQLLLLGLLHQQDMHGYRLYQFIDGELAACTDLKKPTAYFLLNKMAQAGWVHEEISQEGNRPPRRVYSLTPAGEAAFQQLLRDNLASYPPVYFPGDASLAFIDRLDPRQALDLLAQRRSQLAVMLDTARQAPEHAGSLQWVIDHQVHFLASELTWLDEVRQRLEDRAEAPSDGDASLLMNDRPAEATGTANRG